MAVESDFDKIEKLSFEKYHSALATGLTKSRLPLVSITTCYTRCYIICKLNFI